MSLEDGRARDEDAVTVRVLVEQGVLGAATVAAGAAGLDRRVRRFNVMSVPDVVRWVKPDEFLLITGHPLPPEPADVAAVLVELDHAGIAGVGVKLDRWLPSVPVDARRAADAAGLPLLVVPADVAFNDVLSNGFALVEGHRQRRVKATADLRDRLLDAVVRGDGLAGLVTELAAALGGAVAAADAGGVLLADSGGAVAALRDLDLLDDADRLALRVRATASVSEPADPGSVCWVSRPVLEGDHVLGTLVALAADDPGADAGDLPPALALQHATVAAALQLARDREIAAVELRFSSDVLAVLVHEEGPAWQDAVTRAGRFGWDLHRELVAVVADLDPSDGGDRDADRETDTGPGDGHDPARVVHRALPPWAAVATRLDPHAASGIVDGRLVALLGRTRTPREHAETLQSELAAVTRHVFSVGVSRYVAGPDAVRQLHREAGVALDRGRSLPGSGLVLSAEELGLFRLFGQLPASELRAFVRGQLAPVLELDPSERADMLRTLSVFLRHQGNVAESARALHLHYNSLRYRITKLERLLGSFPRDPDLALSLAVALQIHSVTRET